MTAEGGARVLRKEGWRFLTGRGEFVADLAIPGALHAVLAAHAATGVGGDTRRPEMKKPPGVSRGLAGQ